MHRKDEALNVLAEWVNVAQFVSFSPNPMPNQEYSRISGYEVNHKFQTLDLALECLLKNSRTTTINVRSYYPDSPKSHEFIYGLDSVTRAAEAARRLLKEGLHVIVNETIDINDSGVSGVVENNVIEFSPDDTPRCVEKPNVCSLPLRWGQKLLSIVYQFPVNFDWVKDQRFEFSVHPNKVGSLNSHIIGWEIEKSDGVDMYPQIRWPNRFSEMIGDKVFGLLIAECCGFPVPKTTVINRRVAPFTFGENTNSDEFWIRTCPNQQVPGKFSTFDKWVDPFTLMHNEDPDGEKISSVISQMGVMAAYSGAAIVDLNGILLIEGVSGSGEEFMQGTSSPETLPNEVISQVQSIFESARQILGDVRFEWVFDGEQVWIVQLHQGATQSSGKTLVPGEADTWIEFEVSLGLEAFREKISNLSRKNGLILVGHVGITSHIADVARKSGVPTRMQPEM